METNLYPTLVLRKNVQIMIVVLGFLQQQYRNINEIKKNVIVTVKLNIIFAKIIGSEAIV
jgi:hypothetical protein